MEGHAVRQALDEGRSFTHTGTLDRVLDRYIHGKDIFPSTWIPGMP
jgi:hypothetical protein